MKKANGPAWVMFGSIVKAFAYGKGQRINRTVKIKGPAITLSNHTSFYDFLYTMSATYPRRVNFLAAKKMFYEPVLRFFLKHGKAIPKALLEADPVATMQGLKVLKNGGILSIFPEGQIAPSGVTLPMNSAIIKLIKKAEVPVYLVKHHNAYFVNPPWTKKTYHGRINTDVTLLFSQEDIKSLSEDELFVRFMNAFYHDPYAYNVSKRYKYRVTNIKGLERLLYRCPACAEEGLTTKKNVLYCHSCASEYTLTKDFKLADHNIAYFYEKEREYLKKYSKGADFSLSSDVGVESIRGKDLIYVGEGHFTMYPTHYTFKGRIDQEEIELTFDPKLIPSFPSDIGRNIQIYHHGQIYQFIFKNPQLPMKFVLLSEIFYERASNL